MLVLALSEEVSADKLEEVANAAREQVRRRQEASISLRLNARGLARIPQRKAVKTGKSCLMRTRFEVERHFVQVLRETVSPRNIDLWLDNDHLRGNIRESADKNTAEAALKGKMEEAFPCLLPEEQSTTAAAPHTQA